MSTVTLVPNATLTSTGTLVGSPANGVVAVTDGSAGTGVQLYSWTYALTTSTVAAGSIVRTARISVKGFTQTGTIPQTLNVTLTNAAGATLATYAITFPMATTQLTSVDAALAAIDQATVDGMQIAMTNPGTGGAIYIVVQELAVVLVVVAQPTVTVTAPTGTITTATPGVAWTYAGDVDADASGVQQRYEIKVFSAAQYGTPGFDPATAAPAYESGEVVSSVTSTTAGPLPNATTLKAYVRAAQNVNGALHWSTWTAGPAFTPNTDPPVVSNIVADPTIAAVKRAVTRAGIDHYLDPSAGWVYTPDPGPLPTEYVIAAKVRRGFDDAGLGDIAAQMGVSGNYGHRFFAQYGSALVQVATADGAGMSATVGSGAWSLFDPDGDGDSHVAVAVDMNNAGRMTSQGFTSSSGGAWTPVTGVIDNQAAFIPHDSTAVLNIGTWSGPPTTWQGRIYSVEMRSGLDPNPSADRYLDPATGTVTTPDPGPLPAEYVLVAKVRRGFDDAGQGEIAAQMGASGNYGFRFYSQYGSALVQVAAADGATMSPVVGSGVWDLFDPDADGESYVAVSIDTDNAGRMTSQGWTSSDDGATWAPVTGAVDNQATFTPHDSTAALNIGTWVGPPTTWQGRIYSVEMRTGLDPKAGSVVWRFDAEEAPTDATTTTWNDPRGRQWTTSQVGAISGRTLWRFDADDYPGTGSSYVDPRGRTWTLAAPNAILAGGAVKVIVTRDLGHTDWTHVQIERSAVDQSHWLPVRGAVAVVAPDDVVSIYDYEQPEGVPLWYRARGLVMSGGLVASSGDWRVTTFDTVWNTGSCGEWMRSAGDPYGAVIVELVVDEAAVATEHRVGLLDVIGRASPVTVWDVPSLGTGEMTVVTRSFEDAADLQTLLRTAPVILYQGRYEWGHPYRWLVVTNHTTSRRPTTDVARRDYREWTIAYVEVDAPPVLS